MRINDSMLSLIVSGLLVFTATAGWLMLVLGKAGDDAAEVGVRLVVPRGASLGQVADTLTAHGFARTKREVMTAARLMGAERAIKAGIYRIPADASLYRVFRKMTSGVSEQVAVTLREGWTAKLMAEELADKLDIDARTFMLLVRDKTLMSELGIEAPSLEGYLFPETYNFDAVTNEESIIRWMVGLFFEKFGESEKARAKELDMTINEIVTLASIIEGEAIFDDERPMVSSVYHNRLKRRMRLQADPTVQYIIPDGPRRLLESDLWIDSPYNTYRHSGLPPGAIANPGEASILAALWPSESENLYFVAKGDGYHTFSRTIEEHNLAKKKFQSVRREVARRTTTREGN